MPTKSVVVGSAVGLHARPAAIISEAAGELDSEVTIGRPRRRAGRRQLGAADHDPRRRQGRHGRGVGRRRGRRGHDRRAGREGPRRLSEDVPPGEAGGPQRTPQRLLARRIAPVPPCGRPPTCSTPGGRPELAQVQAEARRRTISVSRSGLVAMLRRTCPVEPRHEVVPRAELHPAALERHRRRVVVAVGPDVEPGQVRRLERPHPHLRQVLGQQVRRAGCGAGRAARPARPATGRRRRTPPPPPPRRAATTSRCAPSAPIVRLPRRRVGHQQLGAPQTGGVERLRRRHHRDRVVVGPLQVEVRRVARARQHQRRVDLVADHPRPVPQHDVADALELGPAEHPPPRVVRLGQQQRARARGEQRVEPVEVDLGPLRRRGRPPGRRAPARSARRRRAAASSPAPGTPPARPPTARRSRPGPRRSRRPRATPTRGRRASRSAAPRTRRTPRPAPGVPRTPGSRSRRRARPAARPPARRGRARSPSPRPTPGSRRRERCPT